MSIEELVCVVLWFLGMIPTMTALKYKHSLRPMPDSLVIVLAVVFWPLATACAIVLSALDACKGVLRDAK